MKVSLGVRTTKSFRSFFWLESLFSRTRPYIPTRKNLGNRRGAYPSDRVQLSHQACMHLANLGPYLSRIDTIKNRLYLERVCALHVAGRKEKLNGLIDKKAVLWHSRILCLKNE